MSSIIKLAFKLIESVLKSLVSVGCIIGFYCLSAKDGLRSLRSDGYPLNLGSIGVFLISAL